MVLVGVTSPIWIPLGLVALVIGVPVAGIMALTEKWQDEKKLKTYREDRCAFMKKKSAEYLDQPRSQGLSSSLPWSGREKRPWSGLVTCVPKSGMCRRLNLGEGLICHQIFIT